VPSSKPQLKINTELCLVDGGDLPSVENPKGRAPNLSYCGYPITELMQTNAFEGANSFERVALLLINRELPDKKTYEAFRKSLIEKRALPFFLRNFIESQTVSSTKSANHPIFSSLFKPFSGKDERATNITAKSSVKKLQAKQDTRAASLGMSRLSTITTVMQTHYQWDESQDNEATTALMAILPTATLAWHHFANGMPKEEFDLLFDKANRHEDLASFFLHGLYQREAKPYEASAFNGVLNCYAEHGMNASTTAAVTSISTQSPMSLAIASAINTLAGPLHGRANLDALSLIEQFDSVDEIATKVEDFFARDKLNKEKGLPREKLHGFGHALYKYKDPRASIIQAILENLLACEPKRISLSGKSIQEYYDIAKELELQVWKAKRLPANVDFYMAILLEALHIPRELFTVTFALGRLSGWCAHAKEYRENQGALVRLKNGLEVSLEYTGEKDRPTLIMPITVEKTEGKSDEKIVETDGLTRATNP
jgi:citrate synthase